MATEGEGIGESLEGIAIAESIRKIAAHNARANLGEEGQLLKFLQSWWSKLYNRPLKDPLLLTYTLEELLYEFYDRVERNAAEEERNRVQEVKTEEAKEQEVLDWAEQEEKKELEAIKAKAAAEAHEQPPAEDPTKDPENVKWMEEQIRIAKEQHGETFGEDLEVSFDE